MTQPKPGKPGKFLAMALAGMQPNYRVHLVPLRSVSMPCEDYNRQLALILVAMARAVENRRVDHGEA